MNRLFEQPVTSMLAFCCVRHDLLDGALEHGLRPKDQDVEIALDFEEARLACQHCLLVIDTYAADNLEAVTPKALVNIDPYRTPVAVTAAGGIFTRTMADDLEVLLIFRRGVWDLPKGKLDDSETITECGMREAREELGISNVRIMRELGRTVHGYPDDSTYAVKTTYWFQMETDAQTFYPEADEDIEDVRWFGWEEARTRLGYETLRRHLDGIEGVVLSDFDR